MARGVRTRQGAPPPTGIGRDDRLDRAKRQLARASGPSTVVNQFGARPTDAGIARADKSIVNTRIGRSLKMKTTRSDYETMDTENPSRSTKGKVKR